MNNNSDYIKVPPEAEKFVGRPVGNTRVYRKEGTQDEMELWFDAIDALTDGGQVVSPGGVTMFCPVSRAAVHKRAKEGKLTMFLFYVKDVRPILFGNTITIRETKPYAYIPVSEAKAWKKELIERGLEQGRITEEDLEGRRPDWEGDFMDWKSKWAKEQAKIKKYTDEILEYQEKQAQRKAKKNL